MNRRQIMKELRRLAKKWDMEDDLNLRQGKMEETKFYAGWFKGRAYECKNKAQELRDLIDTARWD